MELNVSNYYCPDDFKSAFIQIAEDYVIQKVNEAEERILNIVRGHLEEAKDDYKKTNNANASYFEGNLRALEYLFEEIINQAKEGAE